VERNAILAVTDDPGARGPAKVGKRARACVPDSLGIRCFGRETNSPGSDDLLTWR
jgi:hypothetical protein